MRARESLPPTLPLLIVLIISLPSPAQQEEQPGEIPECLKLPPVSGFNLKEPQEVTGMSIVAACGEPGVHLFILEVLPGDDEAAPEIQMRLVAGRETPKKEQLLWMESKLMRIKKARTAAGQFIKASKGWAVLHEKISEGGGAVPTVALLTPDQKEKNITTRLVKFDETQHFFSPFIFDLGDKVLALWGERTGETGSIVSATLDPSGQSAPQKQQLVSGPLEDRFAALRAEGSTILAWLEEAQDAADCSDLVVEKFSDAGGSAGRITTARICGDALLTGVRLSGQETLVDGMEGLKGEWRPFEVKIDQGFKEFKVKKSKSPAAGYDADFVRFSNVILWKKRHEESAVSLGFMDRSWPASADGAMSPLALSLCEKEAVGGWMEGKGEKAAKVSFFDIKLLDGDADGVLDDFDACPAGAGIESKSE